MKTLGWLIVAAVMGFGAWAEYGGPARGAAPVGHVDVTAGDGLPVFADAKPVAFDARHTLVPVRVDQAGRTLTLVLDGAGVARAQWPVTIDVIPCRRCSDHGDSVGETGAP